MKSAKQRPKLINDIAGMGEESIKPNLTEIYNIFDKSKDFLKRLTKTLISQMHRPVFSYLPIYCLFSAFGFSKAEFCLVCLHFFIEL